MKPSSENDRIQRTQKIKAQLQQHINRLREDFNKITEPGVQAIFEASAEGLAGSVIKAFEDFEKECGEVWRSEPKAIRP